MSKESKAPSGEFRTTIGGQALIEGIYMRGTDKQSVVVRDQNGRLVVKTEPLRLTKENYPILGIPFVRGAFAFIGTMYNGVKALMYSADFYPDDEEEAEPGKFEQWLSKHLSSEKLTSLVIGLSVVLGVCFSVGLFFLLPTVLVYLLRLLIPMNKLAVNLVEGVVRIIILLLYLVFCSKMPDMRRVFSYHGAEHKSIFCYERGLSLTVENVREMPRFHPRCGTSFLFVVIFIAILVYSVLFTLLTPPNLLVRLLCQLLLLPVVVGISYEINRYVGRHDNLVTRIITAPGLWMQNFTTNEPDDSMIEVGIAALKEVLPKNEGDDRW